MLLDKKLRELYCPRPAVEAGERLGFLRRYEKKVDPYLRPLYDSLYDLLDFEKIQKIEVRYRNCSTCIYERKNIKKLFCDIR